MKKETDKNLNCDKNFSDHKINCNVIRDLLPSYIDHLCSKDSQTIIEEHLLVCPDCTALVQALQEAEAAEKEQEAKQIAYMKKFKKHIGIKDFIGFALLLLFVGTSLYIFSNQYEIISQIYFTALPLILFDAYFLLSDHITKNRRAEQKIILTIASSLILIAGILLAFISIQWVQQENYPFGLRAGQLGNFLGSFYHFFALCELGIFIAGIVFTLKTSNSYRTVINISVTGLFLIFYIHSIFGVFSSPQAFQKALWQSLYLLLEGGCIAVITVLLEKRRLR